MHAVLPRRTALALLAVPMSSVLGCGGRPDVLGDDGMPSDPDPAPIDADTFADEAPSDAPLAVCAGEDWGDVGAFEEHGFYRVGPKRDPVIIGRDASGLFAMSGLCTHARCPLDPPKRASIDYWYCACHGATFDYVGAVRKGPARQPLRHLRLDVCDGRVRVDRSVRVDASERVSP